MREVKIVVIPFEFISVLDIKCVKELNEHGKIMIKGIVSQDHAAKYQMMALNEIWVTVKLIDENNDEKVFFNGILTELNIEKENQVNTLLFAAKTGSYLLDLGCHVRTFQNESYTYDEILKNCLASDSGKYIMLDKQGMAVNNFLVQYKESNWEFIKRLAGYAKTVVIPEDAVSGKNIYFGYRSFVQNEVFEAGSYKVIQDYKDYQTRKNTDIGDISEKDIFIYEFTSREVYGLGETVIFQGKNLIVGKIVSNLVGQELNHTYTLHTKPMGYQIITANEKLAGVSLKANVVDIDKTKVKIQVQNDENMINSGYRWFDFATVYSTPDGTGWYCMPEIGDEVRVIFPDNCEKNSYVVSCVHLTDENRTNPNEKSWKNKQRKEVLFTPEALILRNNKGMSVEISDMEGIKVVSDKKIILQADEDICINSETGVQMSASDNILLSQGGASIQMNDSIIIGGGKIYMN